MWNCRGASNPHFRWNFVELVRDHKRLMVILTETRIGGSRVETICQSLGFTNFYIVDSVGFAGGIWLLWNEDNIICDVLHSIEQEIHACIQVSPHTSPWLISAIYASPHFARRKFLWESLKIFSPHQSLPWLLLGDCNQVLTSEDKFGGNPVNSARANLFKDCLDTCGMLDLGFSGSRYTWSNLRTTRGLIQERLDRCWSNAAWKFQFPNTIVRHLPRTHSDHCPVLLNTDPCLLDRCWSNAAWKFQFPNTIVRHLPRTHSDHCPVLLNTDPCHLSSIKPFRFKSIWFSDPSLFPLIEECWSVPSNSFISNLNCFTARVKVWNKENFGNLFYRKKMILARLSGIQRSLEVRPSVFLTNLEVTLSDEYNNILSLEEEFWALKSRVNWLSDGDCRVDCDDLAGVQFPLLNSECHANLCSAPSNAELWKTEVPLVYLSQTEHKQRFLSFTCHKEVPFDRLGAHIFTGTLFLEQGSCLVVNKVFIVLAGVSSHLNPKNMLQELLVKFGLGYPIYECAIVEVGPPKMLKFRAKLIFAEEKFESMELHSSKKEAEQNIAQHALDCIQMEKVTKCAKFFLRFVFNVSHKT
ncbi:hypothetical protein Vadar_031984 [Vaccinium darrowii]|uniref:Uncharacterized protein n=1 Tax=Vaccinium darrowii TaxID=229202 RepID=A0ACB7ZP28_9ERIC|nr:hypothetical protein Vadar_031984 [Vaccinium darrowii]